MEQYSVHTEGKRAYNVRLMDEKRRDINPD